MLFFSFLFGLFRLVLKEFYFSDVADLWKQTNRYYYDANLSGDAEKMLGLENCFVYMAREAVFECMVYI